MSHRPLPPPDAVSEVARARSPLVLTKLAAPRIRPEHLAREDLLSLLVDGGQRLTLLDSPAGYGKTTLLAAWQRADARRPFAWISLDESDGDPRRFWTYVMTALQRTGPHAKGLRFARPAAPTPPAIADVVLPRMINEIAAMPRALVLVLDDYHRLHETDVHEQLAVLLERGPPNLHVVISTRVDPPLPLARLRANGELVEIRARDLRFGTSEAATLLNDRLGLGLTEAGIGRLVERTDGWPAGLYLAALAVAESRDPEQELDRFASGHRHVLDYFASEVLADLSADERAFLRRAAILSEVTGPLLDAMLERDGSGARLRELAHTNLLFHALDDEPEWYRFSAIFGQLLGAMLVEDEPELIPGLHLRASEWYAAHGIPSRAIEHALSAGRPEAAEQLIASEWQPFADFVQSASFASWLSALPDERIAANPRLALAAAWTAGWGGIRGSWQSWLDHAKGSRETAGLPLGLPSVEAGAVLTRAVFSVNDVGNHLEAAREARRLFEDNPGLRTLVDGSLGVALYHAGLLGEARAHLAANVDRLAAEFPGALPPALAYLSLAFTAAGEPGEGLLSAESALQRAEEAAAHRYAGSDGLVRLALGAALRRLDKPFEAMVELNHAIELLKDETLELDLVQARIERGLALLATGRPAAATVELGQAAAVMAECPDPGAVATRLREAVARVAAEHEGSPTAGPLTVRELEILALLPSELSRREIAGLLFVSANTVQTHVRSIYRKLGVSSRAQAVERARELELLPADPAPPS